jgi:hypothetical protein
MHTQLRIGVAGEVSFESCLYGHELVFYNLVIHGTRESCPTLHWNDEFIQCSQGWDSSCMLNPVPTKLSKTRLYRESSVMTNVRVLPIRSQTCIVQLSYTTYTRHYSLSHKA